MDDLYEVISKMYESSSTIITSNKQFDEWESLLFDPVLATAILNRFVHHCSFITIEGESYRMKERGRIASTKCRGRSKKDRSPKTSDTNADSEEVMPWYNLIIMMGMSPISVMFPQK